MLIKIRTWTANNIAVCAILYPLSNFGCLNGSLIWIIAGYISARILKKIFDFVLVLDRKIVLYKCKVSSCSLHRFSFIVTPSVVRSELYYISKFWSDKCVVLEIRCCMWVQFSRYALVMKPAKRYLFEKAGCLNWEIARNSR